MLDTGRRFVPIELLESIMDTMAVVRMNVLHLHLTDWAAVRWESAAYPALNKKICWRSL
jgi:hexosaminidase